MSFLGRYQSRYTEIEDDIGRIARANVIGGGNRMSDVAIARFGKARVSCWTSARDRQWGRYGTESRTGAVMHFKMQAVGPEECRLSNFELDLKFSAVDSSLTFSSPVAQDNPSIAEDLREVYLIDFPAPDCVDGMSPQSAMHLTERRYWKFSSNLIPDGESGDATTARWVWEAGDCQELQGRILHGGVAVNHPGQPFRLTCHVKGKVSKPGGIKLRFSDRHHEPRTWDVVPQVSNTDIQNYIDQLQVRVKRLNSSSVIAQRVTSSPDPVPSSFTSSLLSPSPEVSTYGTSNIGGAASVHMGNNFYGYPGNLPDPRRG